MQDSTIASQARRILNLTFGYDDFRHQQADIVQTLVEGKDALVLMPTGGGKSLCYQIPAMIREGVGIVVSPLIALMQDQVDALRQLGVQADFINSTLNMEQQQHVEQKMRNGDVDLVYVSPERLLSEHTLNLLDACHIALFAIDEAHCVSQWGHDFRKEYQQLSVLHQRYPGTPRIALTATAEPRTRQEILQQLQLEDATLFISSFDRPNIHYQLSEGQNAREQLWRFLDTNHPKDAGIVYCLSRKKVESTAEWLVAKGRTALPYHAGLSDRQRAEHQARFLREEAVIIVATIAFGMGIDKPDVRFVAHLSLPKSIEAYYQETGRAGRDGAASSAWMAYGLQDVITLRQMMNESDANEQFKRIQMHKLESMLGLCEISSCRRQHLLQYFGEALKHPCGNCDNCAKPPETWDATEASRMAMSAVYRSGQRFGVNYVIDILCGKEQERIVRNGHDRLTVFGIGKEISGPQWRTIFRQLIAMAFLSVDVDGFGSLRLTEKCRPILRGQQSLFLRKQRKPEKLEKKQDHKENRELRSFDLALFEALRNLRLQMAQDQAVPPYIIFHDSTLVDMARQRPGTEEELRYISGVGEKKLERYGDAFLAVIRDYPIPEILNNQLSDNIKETLFLFNQGVDVAEIAERRGKKLSAIYGHLADAIAQDVLALDAVVDLGTSEYNRILNMYEMALDKGESGGSLRSLQQALEEKYDYDLLRCVVASFRNIPAR